MKVSDGGKTPSQQRKPKKTVLTYHNRKVLEDRSHMNTENAESQKMRNPNPQKWWDKQGKEMNLEIGELHTAVDDSNGNSRYPGHLQGEMKRTWVLRYEEKQGSKERRSNQGLLGWETDKGQGAGARIGTPGHSWRVATRAKTGVERRIAAQRSKRRGQRQRRFGGKMMSLVEAPPPHLKEPRRGSFQRRNVCLNEWIIPHSSIFRSPWLGFRNTNPR